MNEIFTYSETRHKIVSCPDSCFSKKLFKKKYKTFKVTSEEELQRISLSRTKRNIQEICLCNDFEFFITITVSSKNCDRFSLQVVQDRMKKQFYKLKRKYKEFKFIFITERHEKGGFHFHGFIKGLPIHDLILFTDDDDIPLRMKNMIKNGEILYHFKLFDNEMGWNVLSKIKDYDKACNYIMKYITKDCIKNEHNQIYFCSRGLKRAEVDLLIDTDLTSIFKKVYQNEYCQCVDINLRTLSDSEKRNLFNYFSLNEEIMRKDYNYITKWLNLFTKIDNHYKIQIHK